MPRALLFAISANRKTACLSTVSQLTASHSFLSFHSSDESVSERQKKAEIFVKVEMAQKQLALSYAMLLLGKGPCGLFPQHRTAGVRSEQL